MICYTLSYIYDYCKYCHQIISSIDCMIDNTKFDFHLLINLLISLLLINLTY